MTGAGLTKSSTTTVVFASAPVGRIPVVAPPEDLDAFLVAVRDAARIVIAGGGEELVLFAAAAGFEPDSGANATGLPPKSLVFKRSMDRSRALRSTAAVLRRQREEAAHQVAQGFAPALDDLDREAQTLYDKLGAARREHAEVVQSAPWQLVLRYRAWLAAHRKNRTLPFRIFDLVSSKMMTRLDGAVARTGPAEAEPPASEPIAASRFRIDPSDTDAWKSAFRRLALFRDVGLPHLHPAISLLTPLWNTPPRLFAETAVSVLDQTNREWEWILVDDGSSSTSHQALAEALAEACPRVCFEKLPANQGISGATNHALRKARGSYIALLDHDDVLHPLALELCLEALESGGLDAVYTDSDKVSMSGQRDEPFHKPAWSPEYFRGVMYAGHLLCTRRDAAIECGGFDSRYDGVQDFEFLLRFSEQYGRIGHIPKILYHWRRAEGSVAGQTEAKGDLGSLQCTAVSQHLKRMKLQAMAQPGKAAHRTTVVPSQRVKHPRVSILIPTKDAPEMLDKCLTSIQALSTYPNYQIICADNDTTDPKALEVMRRPGVERLPCPGKFNFSRVNNLAVTYSSGDYLVFLNNDIEVISPGWMEELLYYAEQPDAGAVGALLLFPNRTVQHAGIVLGFRGTADHVLRGHPADSDGYAGTQACAREVSAVTAACMMVRRETFLEAGGLDEHFFTAYQDVDFCLRLRSRGLRNIYAPRACLFHHESYTRRDYYDFVDRNLLLDRWQDEIDNDPYYNINFSRAAVDYQLSEHADTGKVASTVKLWNRRVMG